MNKDFAFFQQAVLSIIGDLDFNDSLLKTFQFLKKHLPLEAITIDQYSPEKKGITMLAVVTEKGVLNVCQFVQLDQEAATYMEKRSRSRRIITIVNGERSPVSKVHGLELQAILPRKARGYMIGHLTVGNIWVGDLVFVGIQKGCFTARHEHMLGMLLAPFSLAINNRFRLQSILASKKQLDEEREHLHRELRERSVPSLVGEKGGLREVMNSVRQLEGTDTTVLLLGETGTGKEIVASAIQRLSRRREAQFIRVNCGALPESLLDSELFGYEKGSFTGAESLRTGRFEQADGGTLFLDEVGELSLSAQVRLLRVLQDGLVERIGSERPTPVDVRIIAATNRDLSLMRRQGTFREDLFHRLNIFPIRIPPLRERVGDIPELVSYFVERIATRMEILPPPSVLPESLEKAARYSWPGNVRELENIVERALILNPSGPLDISQHLPLHTSLKQATLPASSPATGAKDSRLDEEAIRRLVDERIAVALAALPSARGTQLVAHAELVSLDEAMTAHIQKVLTACHGKLSGPGGAAEILKLHHSTLRNRMKKMGMKWHQD